MFYTDGEKYYLRRNEKYVELKLVFSDNDVRLVPTTNRFDGVKSIKTIDFLSEKARLLAEHNKPRQEIVEEEKIEDEQEKEEFVEKEPVKANYNKYSKNNKKYSR